MPFQGDRAKMESVGDGFGKTGVTMIETVDRLIALFGTGLSKALTRPCGQRISRPAAGTHFSSKGARPAAVADGVAPSGPSLHLVCRLSGRSLAVGAMAFFLCVGLSLPLPGIGPGPAHAFHDTLVSDPAVLVVGHVTPRARRHQPRLQGMADWLVSRLADQEADLGIERGVGLTVPSLSAMVPLLRAGVVDVVSETVMAALYLEEEAGAEILLHELRRGRAIYEGVIIAGVNREIHSLADLAGRSVAFEHANSTTGFLLPMALLRQQGLSAVRLQTPDDRPPPDRVGFVFAGSESNIALWVSRGLVDAGAYADDNWYDPGDTPAVIRENLEIVHRSGPVLRSALLVRGDMPAGLREALRRALLEIGTADDARVVRADYWGIAGYRALEGESAERLAEAARLYPLIRDLMKEGPSP